MERPSATSSENPHPFKLWWKHNWKWAVPVATLALFLLGPLLLVVSPLVYWGFRQAKKHAEEQRHVCELLGFGFEGEGEAVELRARFGEFPRFASDQSRGRGLMTGSLAEHPVTVMEHNHGKHAETLAIFPDGAKGLPDFELSPGVGAWGDKLFAALGDRDINFPDDQEFSNHYLLRGTDETGIRSAFDATMRAFFAANRGWSVHARGGAAMIFRDSRSCAPAQVPGFLADTLTVLAALTRR